MWVDAVTLLVAIVIGIGVGFALLKIFAPQLLSRSGVSQVSALEAAKVRTEGTRAVLLRL
jgi:hypothetical protein